MDSTWHQTATPQTRKTLAPWHQPFAVLSNQGSTKIPNKSKRVKELLSISCLSRKHALQHLSLRREKRCFHPTRKFFRLCVGCEKVQSKNHEGLLRHSKPMRQQTPCGDWCSRDAKNIGRDAPQNYEVQKVQCKLPVSSFKGCRDVKPDPIHDTNTNYIAVLHCKSAKQKHCWESVMSWFPTSNLQANLQLESHSPRLTIHICSRCLKTNNSSNSKI